MKELRVCAITMVFNESRNLPTWLDYYGAQLGFENLLVIDNESDDGSTDSIPHKVGRLTYPRLKGFSDTKRAYAVSKFADGLLKSYDVVLYTDADELVVPNPYKYDGLLDFFSRNNADLFTTVGFDLIHLTENEPPVEKRERLLAQRRHLKFVDAMCKPVATRSPIQWGGGFHSCNREPNVNGDLFLFHTKNSDLNRRLKRQELTRNLTWEVPVTSESGPGVHQRLPDEQIREIFSRWNNQPQDALTEQAIDRLVNLCSQNVVNVGKGREAHHARLRIKVKKPGWPLDVVFKLPEDFPILF